MIVSSKKSFCMNSIVSGNGFCFDWNEDKDTWFLSLHVNGKKHDIEICDENLYQLKEWLEDVILDE